MKKIGYCGLICDKCDAYKASIKNDDKILKELADEWSTHEYPLEEEDVLCFGCKNDKKHFIYCKGCEIRICAKKKDIDYCIDCIEYPCDKLKEFFKQFPDCKKNLENEKKD